MSTMYICALVGYGRIQVWVMVVKGGKWVRKRRGLIARRSGHTRRLRHVPVSQITAMMSPEDAVVRQGAEHVRSREARL